MMRAAHSIKGAARVVNVQPGVEVSHAMEDCFVKAQKAELTLASTVVDVLLAGVDMLQGIAAAAGAGFAAWLESHQPEIASLLQRLQNVVRRTSAGIGRPRRFADVQTTPTDSAQTPVQQESAGLACWARARRLKSPRRQPPQSAGKKPAESSTEEGVVRVTARSLTRLMGLAGESLVEARWLQPFSKSLLQLKHLQAQLADTVESLAAIDRSEAIGGAARRPAERCPRTTGRLPRFALGSHARIRPAHSQYRRLEQPPVSRGHLQPHAAVSRRRARTAAACPRPGPANGKESPT